MTQWHMKSSKKVTGGVRSTFRRSDKRLAWKGGEDALTTIAPTEDDIESITIKGQGNTAKVKLKFGKYVHVTQTGHKAKNLEITSVALNDANSQFARRNIITKGAVVKTKDGEHEPFVKITSRPGQSGVIQGIILKSYVPVKEEKAKARKEKKQHSKKAHKAPENGK